MTNLPAVPGPAAPVVPGLLAVGPFATVPNVVTAGPHRASAVLIGAVAVAHGDLVLLAVAYAVFWVGDIADGWSARRLGQETRVGAVFDIVCDRACTGILCVGLRGVRPVGAPGRRRVRPVVHGARLDAVDGVPVLAGAQPQLLPPGRPPRVAAQLVAAREGGQQRRRGRALWRWARTPSRSLIAVAAWCWSRSGRPAAWSGCSPRRDGELAGRVGARGRRSASSRHCCRSSTPRRTRWSPRPGPGPPARSPSSSRWPPGRPSASWCCSRPRAAGRAGCTRGSPGGPRVAPPAGGPASAA